MGHHDDIQAVVKTGGRPPLVGRAIKDLLAFSNDQWHIAVLLSPEFLDSDGDRLFTGSRKQLLSPIEKFLGDGIRGLLAGVHIGELAIASTTGSSVPEPTTKSPNTFHTIHDVLEHVLLDQSFPQKSLEFAVRDLVQEIHNLHPDLPFKFSIQLVGRELEAEGITRNQQIRNFQVRQNSLQEILTQLVMLANPVTTVKKPNEKDQKLVWVVAPNPDPSDNTNIILITTRQAALKNRYKLPKPFQGS